MSRKTAAKVATSADASETISFMRSLDERYRQASQLLERRFYSIFYSRIAPSPVLVVGYNPGGDPERWDESQLASRTYFENGEHEYVDCQYPLAIAMRNFLKAVLSIDDSQLRAVPKINLIFRRSRNQNALDIPVSVALDEALPFVEEIVVRVEPRIIVFEGTMTADTFETRYCTGVRQCVDGAVVKTPNGKHAAEIYRADRAHVRCLGRDIASIVLGHPSKYSRRAEWGDVISRSKSFVGSVLSR